MEILLQEKNAILENDNTATDKLRDFLFNMDKSIVQLDVTIALSGSLDLGMLVKNGFDKIAGIRFTEAGKITDIQNFPTILKSFICPNQLLSELQNLPAGLEELNVNNNMMLSVVDVSGLEKLRILNVAGCALTRLEELPARLVEVDCAKNSIRKLDLVGLEELKTLDVTGNKNIILENVPKGIIDLKIDNNPFIDLSYDQEQRRGVVDNKETTEIKINYIDALNDYFKQKNRYAEVAKKDKATIYKKHLKKIVSTGVAPTVAKKVANKLAMRFKPKCISCSRPVGTVFKTVETKPNETKHIAHCGDTVAPCKLKIELYNGQLYNIEKQLYEYYDDLNELKTSIIQQKLDNIFNYIGNDTAIKKFKNTLNLINFENLEFSELAAKYNALYADEDRELMIEKKKEAIYDIIHSIKILVDQYASGGDKRLLDTAMSIHVKELVPQLKNLFLLKNEVNEMIMVDTNNAFVSSTRGADAGGSGTQNVERNVSREAIVKANNDAAVEGMEKANVSVLYQRYCALQKMEDYIGGQPRVVHYVK